MNKNRMWCENFGNTYTCYFDVIRIFSKTVMDNASAHVYTPTLYIKQVTQHVLCMDKETLQVNLSFKNWHLFNCEMETVQLHVYVLMKIMCCHFYIYS